MKLQNYPSIYELKYRLWQGIEYDRSKLIRFLDRIDKLKSKFKLNSLEKQEYNTLKEIYNSHNKDNLDKLVKNDPAYCRWAFIELWARKASIEILTQGKYSQETFSVISNIPVSDYKVLIKRTQELTRLATEISTATQTDNSTIPGVK